MRRLWRLGRIRRRWRLGDRIAGTQLMIRDLLRGLFSLSTHDAPPECDYAHEIEERYSKPRRCC